MGYISDIRKLIGHSPIMMTAAMCILYDREKGLLLEKRSDDGTWCVPGGGLELGETLEQALAREVREETSLEIADPVLFDVQAGVHMVYPNGDEGVLHGCGVHRGKLHRDAEAGRGEHRTEMVRASRTARKHHAHPDWIY